MDRKDFSFKYDHSGYLVYHKDQCLGGAGTLRRGRRLPSNLKFYKQQAELRITEILKAAE